MPKASPIKTSLNAGEFSPLMRGHVDLQKYNFALETCENMIPLIQGPARRRGGSYFVSEVKDSAKSTRMIKFQFSRTQSYAIELGEEYARFYKDREQITNPDGSPYEIITPYQEEDLFDLKFFQSADFLFITHPNYPVAAIKRFGDTNWTHEDLQLTNGPFLDGNAETTGDELIENGKFNPDISGWTDKSIGASYISMRTVTVTFPITRTFPQYQLLFNVNSGNAAIAEQQITIDNPSQEHTFKLQIFTGNVKVKIGTTPGADDILPETTLTYASGLSVKTLIVPAPGVASVYLQISTTIPGVYIDNVSMKSVGTKLKLASTAGYGKGAIMELQSEGNAFFEFGHSDSLWKLKDGNHEIIVQSLSYIDSATLSVQALSDVPAALQNTFTENWHEGLYNGVNGYPTCGVFFQNRLVLAGTREYPQRVDFSRSGDYFNFQTQDPDGTVVDSHSIAITINSNEVNNILWISGNEKGLLVGTIGKGFMIRADSSGKALTPSNAQSAKIGQYGSQNIQPEEISNALLFVQKGGRKIRELTYTFTSDGYEAQDMTILAEHATLYGIKEMTYQSIPNNILWCVRNDGILAGFTYERTENVLGWHRHIFGGVNSEVKSVSVVSFGDTEDLWIIASRTIDGQTKQYIEYVTPEFNDEMEPGDAVLMDATKTYNGTTTTVITGLDHLEGETVRIMADGYAHPDRTVSGGEITLELAAEKVHVGLPNTWKLKTLPIEAGAADGTAQGKTKRIHKFVVRVYKSLAIQYGRTDDELRKLGNIGFAFLDPIQLFTGDIVAPQVPGSDTDGAITLTGDGIYPVCILAIMPQVVTNDAR